VRAALLLVVLVTVLTASALNLALGALWLVALAGVRAMRGRVPMGPALVLALSAALGVVGAWRGWLEPPATTSYGEDEVAWLGHRLRGRGTLAPAPDRRAGLIARLAATRAEEGRSTTLEIERRAGAAVALARGLGRLRGRAPAEVQALETAVRRLAFTLTAAEFQDLDARRARGERYLTELGARLDLARDDAELDAISRALEPAVLASITLQPVREDLTRVDGATRALFHALGGGDLLVDASAIVGLDDDRGETTTTTRYRLEASPPARITRLVTDGLHAAGPRERGRAGVEVVVDGGPPRAVPGSGTMEPGAPARRIELVERRVRAATVAPLQTTLRRIPFEAVELGPDQVSGPLLVTLALDDVPGLEALVRVDLPPPRLLELAVARRALFWVGVPGTVVTTDSRDLWRPIPPAAPMGDPLRVELVPPTWALRNRGYLALRPFLYQPNLAALGAGAGLAALTVLLTSRRRPPAGAQG
jgi:hypothetical protein